MYATSSSGAVSWMSAYPPRNILVLTPRREWFEAYLDEEHLGAPGRARGANGTMQIGQTTYRHIASLEQARGYDRSTPLVCARRWPSCPGAVEITERFRIRGR